MQNGPITLTPLHNTPLPASACVEKDVTLTMRDGTHVAVDVYRPQRSGLFPTLYAVSPYRKDLSYLPRPGSTASANAGTSAGGSRRATPSSMPTSAVAATHAKASGNCIA